MAKAQKKAVRKKRKSMCDHSGFARAISSCRENLEWLLPTPESVHWQLGSEGVYTPPSPTAWGAASGGFLCTSGLPYAQEEWSLKQVPRQRHISTWTQASCPEGLGPKEYR